MGVYSLRIIASLLAAPIPPIQHTSIQNVSLLDVLGRGMIGDLLGWGESINIALEIQKGRQDGYAVRGTLTSVNEA